MLSPVLGGSNTAIPTILRFFCLRRDFPPSGADFSYRPARHRPLPVGDPCPRGPFCFPMPRAKPHRSGWCTGFSGASLCVAFTGRAQCTVVLGLSRSVSRPWTDLAWALRAFFTGGHEPLPLGTHSRCATTTDPSLAVPNVVLAPPLLGRSSSIASHRPCLVLHAPTSLLQHPFYTMQGAPPLSCFYGPFGRQVEPCGLSARVLGLFFFSGPNPRPPSSFPPLFFPPNSSAPRIMQFVPRGAKVWRSMTPPLFNIFPPHLT